MKCLGIVLAAVAVARAATTWTELFRGDVYESCAGGQEACRTLLQTFEAEACKGEWEDDAMISPKKTWWNTGWRRLASGLSGLGQSPVRSVKKLVEDNDNPWRWMELAGYFFIENLTLLSAVTVLGFVLLVLPWLLIFVPFRPQAVARRRIFAELEAKQKPHYGLLLTWLFIVALIVFTVVSGGTHAAVAETHVRQSVCETERMYNQFLYRGVHDNDGLMTLGPLTRALDQLSLVSDVLDTQSSDPAAIPTAAQFFESILRNEYGGLFNTHHLLSQQAFVDGASPQYNLNLGLAVLSHPDTSIENNFQAAFGTYMQTLNDNLQGIEISGDTADAMRAAHNLITEKISWVNNTLLDRYVYPYIPRPLAGSVTAIIFIVGVSTVILFIAGVILSWPFLLRRLAGPDNRFKQPSWCTRVWAVPFCILCGVAGASYFVLSAAGLGLAYSGSVACDMASTNYLLKRGLITHDHRVNSILRNHCVLGDRTTSWLRELMSHWGVNSYSLSHLSFDNEETDVALQAVENVVIGDGRNITQGWNAEEISVILPQAGDDLKFLSSVIGPEFAMTSVNPFVCGSESKVCETANKILADSGVKLEAPLTELKGIQDIEAEIQRLTSQAINFREEQIKFSQEETIDTTTSDNTTEFKARILRWQGARLASVYYDHIRAPAPMPETKGLIDPCPISYPCSLFSNRTGYRTYDTFAPNIYTDINAAAATLATASNVNDLIIARSREENYSSLTSSVTLINRLTEDYDCHTLVSQIENYKDTVCGLVLGDIAALGFAWLLFGILATLAMFGMVAWRRHRPRALYRRRKEKLPEPAPLVAMDEISVDSLIFLESPLSPDHTRDQLAEIDVDDML